MERPEEVAKKFADEVLKKYKDLVKSIVMMGSAARGEFKPKSDIDVFVIIDDFLLEDKLREEAEKRSVKELGKVDKEFVKSELVKMKLDAIERINDDLERIASKISSRLSVQPSYTLTEFWDYAKVGHPIIYNFIKEGKAVYDTGFFRPIKRLLETGRITATREAIERYLEDAPKKLMRAKTVKLLMLAEDCYYAILNSAQAVLMFLGISPPVPSRAYEVVVETLVKPGILEPQYAEWLKEIVEIRKKIEHKELREVSGSFVDEWLEKAEKFVKKMVSLLGALEIRKRQKILERTHEVMYKAALTALKSLKKEPEKKEEIPTKFKEVFIDSGLIDGYYWKVWKRVEELKKLLDQKRFKEIPDREVYELREHVRKLIRDLAKVLKKEEAKKEKKDQP